MITNCITTLQTAASLRAAGIVDRIYEVGRYESGDPKCLVVFSRPVSTQFLQEVTMSHKTEAAVATAAPSYCCASHSTRVYGDNSTKSFAIQEGFLTIQEGGSER